MVSGTGSEATVRAHPVSLAAWLGWGGFSGFVSGVLFIALTSWFTTSIADSALAPFQLVATLAEGPPAATATVWIGMAIHSLLAVLFGLVFAALVSPLRGTQPAGRLLWAGLLYGGVVYVVNFQVLARFVEYWAAFRDANQAFELAVHLVYGTVLAALLALLPARTRARRTEDAG